MRLRHYFSEIWTVYVDEREVMPEEQFDQVSTAYLVMKNGPQIGKRVELWKNVTTIGRSRECDLFLEDLAVHRKQASILRKPRAICCATITAAAIASSTASQSPGTF